MRQFSAETRAKMTEAHKNRTPQSEENRRQKISIAAKKRAAEWKEKGIPYVKRRSPRLPRYEGKMVFIPLGKGREAKVCACHAHLVTEFRWGFSASWCGNSGYAIRRITTEHGESRHVRMHTVINATPNGFETDHINGDKLDNRCCNLRAVTRSQNLQNNPSRTNSGFKGVTGRDGKWRAQCGGYLGIFDSPEEAARCYDQAAIIKYGRDAKCNFPIHNEKTTT